jgi:hypothetical protein
LFCQQNKQHTGIMKNLVTLLTLFCLATQVMAQNAPRRTLAAKKSNANIKVDGDLSEAAWKTAALATHFIELRPNNGQQEDSANRTEVFFLYDNIYLYVAGYCHEAKLDSITKELVGRDELGSNDFCGIILDTYLDRINATGFFVTPLGEQFDTKYSNNGEDPSWNGVWDSQSKIVADGWTFEMKIPLSALRFNPKPNQTWGLNFFRKRNKSDRQLTWNFVNQNVNGFINQFGDLSDVAITQSPIRLQFFPYFSSYVNHFPSKDPNTKAWTNNVNGGLDIKYGITESFTLDLTAIPDFGQVQSDNQVLNLTPFEVQFNENRAFFTEGTELFNKGNSNSNGDGGNSLFYSRRIGGEPLHLYDVESQLKPNEKISFNPSTTKLLNATKVSGRTKGNLGIGVLNAIIQSSEAEIENTNGSKRNIETNPLTNYSMLVFDQALKNNSSITLMNTNVWRSGDDYDANVTQVQLDLNNKANTYNLGLKFGTSTLFNYNGGNTTGFQGAVGYGKTGGVFNWNFSFELYDDKYDPNDMGILFNNNYTGYYMYVGYAFNQPTSWYRRIKLNYNFNYQRRFRPDDYQNFSTNVNGFIQWQNTMRSSFWINYVAANNDFYEPRVAGKVFVRPQRIEGNFYHENNEANKYNWGGGFYFRLADWYGGKTFNPFIFHRYRFSDKLSISHNLDLQRDFEQAGFTTMENSNPVFASRDRVTIENVLTVKYNFTNRMGLRTRVRHYLSTVENRSFYNLAPNGLLSSRPRPTSSYNQNYNAFNVDMVFTWQFALGSFINIVWKDAVYDFRREVEGSYFKNLGNTLGEPQNNNLSFKIIYFLDYLELKKKR